MQIKHTFTVVSNSLKHFPYTKIRHKTGYSEESVMIFKLSDDIKILAGDLLKFS